MPRAPVIAIALLALGFIVPATAGEIYKWTAPDGVVVITNRKPPQGGPAPLVIPYTAAPPGAVPEAPADPDPSLQAAREARDRLADARQEAEAAEIKAAEAAETAKEYREKSFPRKRRKRIVEQRRARLSAEAALKAEADLITARENVADAEATAAAAEARARQTDAVPASAPAKENVLPLGP